MAKAPFPMTLHFILQSESPSVVSWDFSGSSFRILDHHTFCSVILPRHFKHNKFTSFQRQLNFYSFQKRNEGPLSGAYYHPLFHRDHYNLVYQMKRTVRKHPGSEEDKERQDLSQKQPAFFTQQQSGGGVTPFRPPPQLQGIPGQLAPAATVASQQQALHAFLANSFTQQQHASMSVANQFGTMNDGTMQPTHRAVDKSWGTVFPSPHHFQNSVASSAVAASSASAGTPPSSTAAQSFDFKQLQTGFLNARASTAARVTADMQTNNDEDAAHDRSWAAVDQGAAKVAKTSESVTSVERNLRAGGSGEGPSPESLGLALSRLTVGGETGAGAFLDVAQDLISKHGCEQSLVTALKLLQRCVPNSGPESVNQLQAPYAAAPAVFAAAVPRPAYSSAAPLSFASLVLQAQQAPPPVPMPVPMPVVRRAPQGFNDEFEMGAFMTGHGVHPPSIAPPPSYQIKQPLQLQKCFVPPSASAISDHPPKVPPLPTTQAPLVWREHMAFSEADNQTPEEPSFLEAKVPVTRV